MKPIYRQFDDISFSLSLKVYMHVTSDIGVIWKSLKIKISLCIITIYANIQVRRM